MCEKENLQTVNFFTEKLIQTYEMMVVRHGYVVFFCNLLPDVWLSGQCLWLYGFGNLYDHGFGKVYGHGIQ